MLPSYRNETGFYMRAALAIDGLISILIYNKYFHIATIILARNLQTVCNIKRKSWSQVSGLRSRFLVLVLRLQIPSFEALILSFRFWVLNSDLWSWAQGLSHRFLGLGPLSNYYRVWEKMQSVISITRCGSYY